MLRDFFKRINISILLTSFANKEIFTWALFNANDLIIITAVKRPTQCICFLCLTSGAKEGGLIEMGGAYSKFLAWGLIERDAK